MDDIYYTYDDDDNDVFTRTSPCLSVCARGVNGRKRTEEGRRERRNGKKRVKKREKEQKKKKIQKLQPEAKQKKVISEAGYIVRSMEQHTRHDIAKRPADAFQAARVLYRQARGEQQGAPAGSEQQASGEEGC